MPLVIKDRVQETTTTTGTGTVTLAGAVSGFQSFSVIGDGNTTFYSIVGGTQWELGIGTYTSSGTTLSRDTILESSIGGSAVNFSAGTKTVFCTYPAERSVYVEGSSIVPGATATLPVSSGGTGSNTATFSGANITSLNASNISSGLLAVANGGTNNAFFTVSGPASSAKTYTFSNENMSVGFRNIPPVGTKTGSYTLATGDVGEYVQVGSGGSITIPDATFAEGDAISIFNNTSGNVTVTCSITTAYIAGTDSDKASVTLATRGVCTVLFISGTVCVITGNVT